MKRFLQPNWWISPNRWWYTERPFPLPLIFGVVLLGIIAFAIILGLVLL